jgi:hypothetical protein
MKKLLEVKKEIGTLSKNSKNPFFKSQYLDLTAIIEAVEPILQKHGLVLLQPIKTNVVSTEIYDAESGKLVCESSMMIPEQITDPQKLGSCVTYFRRYTLKSLLAIAEQDDDGNLAAKITKPKIDDSILVGCDKWTPKQKAAVKNKYKLTASQLDLIK